MKHISHRVQASTTGLEILAVDRIELAGLGLVDQVEQPRETVAQIEAAPASVADVEHTPQLGIDLASAS